MQEILRKDGWVMIKSNGGSLRQFKHPAKSGRVTVPGKLADDLRICTWNSIVRQTKL